MSNGTPWTPEHDATLRSLAGKLPAAEIAAKLGCSASKVHKEIAAAGLPGYKPERRTWTRRDWLLSAAAGLTEEMV